MIVINVTQFVDRIWRFPHLAMIKNAMCVFLLSNPIKNNFYNVSAYLKIVVVNELRKELKFQAHVSV